MTDAKPQPHYITLRGFTRLNAELRHLTTVERPRVVQEVSDAAALGDRSENAEYIYGKKRLREIDRRLRYLSKTLEKATVVDPSKQSGNRRVFFGATVTVEDDDTGEEHTWQLVGVDEVDASVGHISLSSPIGGALLGKAEGDDVIVTTPSGTRNLAIVAVTYK